MTTYCIDIQHRASDVSLGASTLKIVFATAAGLGMLIWLGLIIIFGGLNIHKHVVWVLSAISFGVLLCAAMWAIRTQAGSLVGRAGKLVGYETISAVAGTLIASVLLMLTIFVFGGWLQLSWRPLFSGAFVPAFGFSCVAMFVMAAALGDRAASAERSLWADTLTSMAWFVVLGGFALIIAMGLFVKIPLELFASVAGVFVCALISSIRPLNALCAQSVDHAEAQNNAKQKWLIPYYIGVVPALSFIGAYLASPQLAPFFAAVGFGTICFGLHRVFLMASR